MAVALFTKITQGGECSQESVALTKLIKG